jgi:hypothetical protein
MQKKRKMTRVRRKAHWRREPNFERLTQNGSVSHPDEEYVMKKLSALITTVCIAALMGGCASWTGHQTADGASSGWRSWFHAYPPDEEPWDPTWQMDPRIGRSQNPYAPN